MREREQGAIIIKNNNNNLLLFVKTKWILPNECRESYSTLDVADVFTFCK